jgi:DNA-directed RNA polymerase subunit L/DNA-directed RNA polymerase alpha subunit
MKPVLKQISEENDVLRFTLAEINVSFANAIRRIILDEIPTIVLGTEIYKDNSCSITVNTGRLHNELVKQRLSSIPVHISSEKEMESFPSQYILEVNLQNNTETMMIVTTEDFKIKEKESGKYMAKEEVRQIFPPNAITNSFIDFIRLRPRIGDSIPGEQIKLTCEFTIGKARQNGMFNVVSKCAYGNTPDLTAVDAKWEEIRQKMIAENDTKEEIEFQKKNYYLLDAQRQFIPDSFDFVIQTIGVFENKTLVQKACSILQKKMTDMIEALDSDVVPISLSETTMENSYDVVLENEDYTIGKVIEYILYEKFYMGEEIMSFCGFKKYHPHDADSKIRVAYKLPTDKHMVRQHLKVACLAAAEVFTIVYKMW